MEALLYVTLFISFICLSLVLFIGIISIKQFASLKHLQSIFKYLFHTAWLLSSIGLVLICISMIAHITLRPTYTRVDWPVDNHHNYFLVMHGWGYAFLYVVALVILLVLLLRLHFSFKNSIYEISLATKCILGILYVLTCLMFLQYIFDIIYFGTINYAIPQYNIVWSVPGYVLTSIIAIVLFGSKLMRLTGTRATSIYAVGSNDTDEETSLPKLNAHQIQMIETTTRYVSLLSLAIFSTVCAALASFFVLTAAAGHYYELFMIWHMFGSVDCLVNIICLYLQYTFATDYYHKYCKCLHLCFRCMLTRQATKALMKRYKKCVEQAENEETVQLRVIE
eukprot:846750_1